MSTASHAAGTRRVVSAAGAIAFLLAAAACESGSAHESRPAKLSASADSNGVLATIGDERITVAHLNGIAGERLAQLQSQYQRARSEIIETALDSVIRNRTLGTEAQRRGKSIDELIAAEAGAASNPSDVEDAAARLEERLRAEQKVVVAFRPYRLQFDNAKAPALGPASAPVTLVEFSDFQCPFCARSEPVLKQVREKYGDKVQIVYRQFPLTSIHQYAFKAAEASLCAHEQGKFWPMHEALFADQSHLTVADLKATAGRIGLDRKKFDSCMDTGRAVEQVENDQRDGQRAGINGTPSMFINGVPMDAGAIPFNVLDAAIQKELARGR